MLNVDNKNEHRMFRYVKNQLEKFSDVILSRDSNITAMTNMVASITPMALVGSLGLPPEILTFLGVGGSYAINLLLENAKNIDEQNLSFMQNNRLHEGYKYITSLIINELESGRKVRDDGFFKSEKPSIDRSSGEEIFEGILYSIKDSYEQKKIAYYANFLVNVVFSEEIDRSTANYFIRLMDELSYQQLEIIKVLHDGHECKYTYNESNAVICHEIYKLYRLGICERYLTDDKNPIVVLSAEGVPSISDGDYSRLVLTPLGKSLYNVMALGNIEGNILEGIL